MRFSKYAAAALTAALAMSVTVFGEEETSVPEKATEETVTEERDEETKEEEMMCETGGETVYPVTLHNSDETEVVIEKEPERILSLGPNITELIYTLDAQDRLVARTSYCDYPEEVTELPDIGSMYEPDVEAILAQEPDLVVASALVADDIMKQLTDADITVMYLYEEHDIEGVYKMIDTLGLAVNCQDEAVKAVDAMKEKIAGVKDALKDLKDPKTVYYLVGYGEGGDYTAGGDTFIHGILTLAGAVNIAADVEGWSYSAESLLEADPDFIFVPEWAYEGFLTTEPYTELSAVKAELAAVEAEDEGARRVLTLDINMFERQCARNADAVELVAKTLYPEYFVEEDEKETAEETTEADKTAKE